MKAGVANSNPQKELQTPIDSGSGGGDEWTVVKSKNHRKKASKIAGPRKDCRRIPPELPQVSTGRPSESRPLAQAKSGSNNQAFERRKEKLWVPTQGKSATANRPLFTGSFSVPENSLQARPVIFSSVTEAGPSSTVVGDGPGPSGPTGADGTGNDATNPPVFALGLVEDIPDMVVKVPDSIPDSEMLPVFTPVSDDHGFENPNQSVEGEDSGTRPAFAMGETPFEMVESGLDLNG